MFVTSLANDINYETPWQKIEWRKATFPVELPLHCAVLTGHTIYLWLKNGTLQNNELYRINVVLYISYLEYAAILNSYSYDTNKNWNYAFC